jgi:hypothetical protein
MVTEQINGGEYRRPTIVVSYSGLSFFDCPFGLRYSLTFIYYKKQIIRNTVIKHFVDIGGIDVSVTMVLIDK